MTTDPLDRLIEQQRQQHQELMEKLEELYQQLVKLPVLIAEELKRD